ncbi:GLE1-like protein-domain-containing protein [Fomitopsis serialis]|uniref:GLE1-like protein-domain-containing protein n=1 Tax=Fomitopsis serialis TaxID=139415 RepID=UPI002007957A|nr:GLE1-like protein-domain-containing protein [Neoantrodia serialis]KAH9924024.1 GLE1-like protein-domain-containing protein [Neoantrodia serialis]
MRFSAPRSPPPPSVPRQYRSRSTFGVPSDSEEDEEEYYSELESDSESGSSFDASGPEEDETYLSDDLQEILTLSRPTQERPKRSPAEQHYINEALVSVRLRANHHDPYEEWKSDLKEESLRVARLDHSLAKGEHHKAQLAAHAQYAQRRATEVAAARHKAQTYVAHINTRRDKEMDRLRTEWETRNKHLWEHIEGVIRTEDEKVRAKEEEERKKREAEEQKRREEEELRRKEEEKRRQEEEERKKEKEREEEEARKIAEAEQARKEKEAAEAEQRDQLGFSTASEDWQGARENLKWLKTGPVKTVKSNKELKSLWSAGRRAITPKVGQLTNDPESIDRISRQLVEVVYGKPQHPEAVYFALLSSLAKAILLQAETEVTAEKRSAGPLAQVAANLLGELSGFAEAFWAKLCQRTGGWPIPIVVPQADWNGMPFSKEDRRKALGYRDGEGLAEYTARVTGIMRVYFHILFAEVDSPLDPVFRLPRVWTYFARMLTEPVLLQSSVAPSVLHAALDVGGARAKQIWGKQWVKLLAQLYEAATVGLEGAPGRLLGGQSSEGIAARVRVQLEIERIMTQ